MSKDNSNESHLSFKSTPCAELQLVVVRDPAEIFFFSKFMFIIPTVYLFRALLQYINIQFAPALLDFVKMLTEIALLIAFSFSKILFFEIKYRMYQVLSGKAICHKTSNEDDSSIITKEFITRFDYRLNHPARRLVGIVSALAVFVYYMLRIGGPNALLEMGSFLTYVDKLLYIFPTVGYAYFGGIVGWKLVATSYTLMRMAKDYEVNVRVEHPDGAGGLMPIGMLCVHMVYVTVVPTVVSTFILTVPLWVPAGFLNYVKANEYALFGLTPAILLVGICGSCVGLLPIFRFHEVMKQHKLEITRTLNMIAEEIVALKMVPLEISDNRRTGSIEDTWKELNALQSVYEAYDKTPTWPMDKRVLARIWGTQSFLFGQLVILYNAIKQLTGSN